MRIQTMAMYGYRYIPFTKDDLDKKPEVCRRVVFGLLGRYATNIDEAFMELSVYERELLRYALRLQGRIKLSEACFCLQLGAQPTRKVLKTLVEKQLITPVGAGQRRYHEYEMTQKARDFLLSR
jgi:hypothetical protein